MGCLQFIVIIYQIQKPSVGGLPVNVKDHPLTVAGAAHNVIAARKIFLSELRVFVELLLSNAIRKSGVIVLTPTRATPADYIDTGDIVLDLYVVVGYFGKGDGRVLVVVMNHWFLLVSSGILKLQPDRRHGLAVQLVIETIIFLIAEVYNLQPVRIGV
jgi:hypothetical protein